MRSIARPAETEKPSGAVVRKKTSGATARKKAAGRRRRFAVVVVVPVMLMLGSVYLHTVSAGLTGKVAGLEERLARAGVEGERLGVRAAELSGADRIRSLAAEKLKMRDPYGADLEVYGKDREDGTSDGGQEKGGQPR
jgi:cell division protein FtsL